MNPNKVQSSGSVQRLVRRLSDEILWWWQVLVYYANWWWVHLNLLRLEFRIIRKIAVSTLCLLVHSKYGSFQFGIRSRPLNKPEYMIDVFDKFHDFAYRLLTPLPPNDKSSPTPDKEIESKQEPQRRSVERSG